MGISKFATAALIAGGMALASTAALAECKPSKWGADDEIGNANYVSPERTLAAMKLVKTGNSHPLGIVVDPKMPAFPPRTTSIQVVSPGQNNGGSLAGGFGWDMVYNDDLAQLWFGTGPQLDGLGHLGEAGMYYNCNKGKDIAKITGLTKLGTHNVPPMIARAVLVDMAKYHGVASLKGGQAITEADLKDAMKKQGVSAGKGDIVIVHTGWTDAMLEKEPKTWVSTEPGLDNAAMAYLASLDLMAVGADTWGVEVVPPAKGDRVFYGHVSTLMNGIYILETMNTGRLAKEGVNEFAFVLGQARIKGTVQMIINPVAMW